MNYKRAELHLHTKLSDDISVIGISEIFENATKFGLKAIAFTNLNNVQDFPEIMRIAEKCNDIKTIYGAELRYINENNESIFGITVLVKNQNGIKGLYEIISSMHNNGACDLIDLNILKKHRKNLLIGSCGTDGELFSAIAADKTQDEIAEIAELYDYFEVYPALTEREKEINAIIVKLGQQLYVPVIATSNAHYFSVDDAVCRDVVCVSKGLSVDSNKNLWLRSTKEMLDEFSYLSEESAEAIVITNPQLLADFINPVKPLRNVAHPPKTENAYEQVNELAYSEANRIYGRELPKQIEERLQKELDWIKKVDASKYFLICHELVKYINSKGYYVGARGLVGSSLIAFLLGITDINPMPAHYYCTECHFVDFDVVKQDGFDLQDSKCPVCGEQLKSDGHDIPVEFFMGYNGSKMPDIDLNFPSSKQYEAVELLQKELGVNKVAHAGTVSSIIEHSARSYIDIYEQETGECFSPEQEKHICEKICGVKRYEGTHPGGFFILPEELEFEDFTPMRENNVIVSPVTITTHLNFHTLLNNIIKFDVLGHIVPDMLKKVEELTDKTIKEVVWNDAAVYSLFEDADTLCIPEFGVEFVRDVLHKTKPKTFEELVIISNFSHGTNVWIDNGEKLFEEGCAINELPTSREDAFLQLENYGVERELAFEIADYVRRGKLFFDSETTNQFICIMRGSNVPEWYIAALRRIRYLFSKAHSVGYVMNAVRMAWFKKYYPKELYKSYLDCYYEDTRNLTGEELEKYETIKKLLEQEL